jgi:hypothetical protein
MNKIVIIEVRQDHIDKGLKKNCHSCPVALAVKEKFPNWRQISINGFDLYHGYFDIKCVELPVKVYNFVGNFDSGRPVKPFKFKIKINENHP